jgi:hypothetical protein
MRLTLIALLILTLSGCALRQYRNETVGQCETSPKVDGAALGTLAGVSLGVASASTPMGVVSGLLVGGSYFVAHDAMCRARN